MAGILRPRRGDPVHPADLRGLPGVLVREHDDRHDVRDLLPHNRNEANDAAWGGSSNEAGGVLGWLGQHGAAATHLIYMR